MTLAVCANPDWDKVGALKRLAKWLRIFRPEAATGPTPPCTSRPRSPTFSPHHPSHLVTNHLVQDVSRRYHPLRHGLQPWHSCPRPRLRIRTVIPIPPFLSPPRCPSSNQTSLHCPPRPRPPSSLVSVDQYQYSSLCLENLFVASCRILPSCLAPALPSSSSFDRAVGDVKPSENETRRSSTPLRLRLWPCIGQVACQRYHYY